jgi:hypothetical protein
MPPTSAIRRLGVGLVLLVACGPSTAPTPAAA